MVLFESGWENSGGSDVTDDGAWTGSAGGTPTVVSDPIHCGSYALEGTKTNGVGPYTYKDLTAESTIYVRFYVRWDSNPTSGNYHSFGSLRLSNVGTYLCQYGITNASGTIKWALYNTSWHVADTPNPTAGNWYCVEVLWDAGTSNGEMWVDGVSVLSGLTCSARRKSWIKSVLSLNECEVVD